MNKTEKQPKVLEKSRLSAASCASAIDAGLMTDVDGTIQRPKDFVTRQELATSLAATVKK